MSEGRSRLLRCLARRGLLTSAAVLTAACATSTPFVAYDEARSYVVHEVLSRPTGIGGVVGFDMKERPTYYPDTDPRDVVLAEVLFNPVLSIHSGLYQVDLRDGSTSINADGTENHWRWNLGIAPAMLFRAYRQTSSPILSPSFLPTLFAELTRVDSKGPVNDRRSVLFGFGLAYAHHSNGGEGCEFLDEQRVADECLRTGPDPAPTPDVRGYRVREGNFTTNFLEGSVHLGHYWLRGRNGSEGIKGSVLGRAVLEYHVGIPHVFGSPAPDELLELYGTWRPRVEIVAEVAGGDAQGGFPEAFRLRGRASYEHSWAKYTPHPGFKPGQLRIAIDVQHQRVAREWALGVEYFNGHDHYNVEFIRNIGYFVIGLKWYPISAGFI